MRSIFILPEGEIRVINKEMVTEEHRINLTEAEAAKAYLAPEKLHNFSRIDKEESLNKELAFSLGLVLLEAAQLDFVEELYNYNKAFLDTEELNSMIDALGSHYSPGLMHVLTSLLEVNPIERVSITQLQEKIDSIMEEGSRVINKESITALKESRNTLNLQPQGPPKK